MTSWKFRTLITDLPLDHPPKILAPSALEITGDIVRVYVGGRALTLAVPPQSQFSTSEIQDVAFQEGSPSIGSAVAWGILGGLVGGRIYVVVKLNNGCSLAFESGKRTTKAKMRSARIAGEIKQAAGVLEVQTKDGAVQTPEAISDTKECPYCAETIKAKAIKCRYCGSDLAT